MRAPFSSMNAIRRKFVKLSYIPARAAGWRVADSCWHEGGGGRHRKDL